MAAKYFAATIGLFAVIIISGPLPASAEIYKYVDTKGITRYTDNLSTIPPEYRQQVTPSTDQNASEPDKTMAVREETASGSDAEAPGSPAPRPPADLISHQESPSPEMTDRVGHEQSSQIEGNPETPGADANSSAGEIPDKPVETVSSGGEDRSAEQIKEPAVNDVSARESQSGDRRKALEEKKMQMDLQYRSLLEERKRLSDHRQNLGSRSEIESYNRQVQQLNDKIQEYRNQRQAFEAEVQAFNDSLK